MNSIVPWTDRWAIRAEWYCLQEWFSCQRDDWWDAVNVTFGRVLQMVHRHVLPEMVFCIAIQQSMTLLGRRLLANGSHWNRCTHPNWHEFAYTSRASIRHTMRIPFAWPPNRDSRSIGSANRHRSTAAIFHVSNRNSANWWEANRMRSSSLPLCHIEWLHRSMWSPSIEQDMHFSTISKH